jgi:hypothetical protein
MSSYITNPHIQFLDEDGKPLAYGTVETYIAGTTNEYATMKDFNGTMNPSKIVLDDDGSCCIILPNDQLIKMIIRTREGRLFRTYDNVGAGAGGSGAGGGDYYGSDFIAIDQIARVISLKNYKHITTDNTLIMDEDAYKITLKVNPEIIDVNKTIEGKAGINVEENEDKVILSLDGNNIDITSDSIEVSSEYDEDTGVRTFNLECDIPEPIDAYTKAESDAKYQEKGNYALRSEIPDISNLASKDYVDGEIDRSNEYTVELTDALDDRVDSVEEELDEKQDTLVSGTNIKTINGNSLLGSGNISITSGANLVTSTTTTITFTVDVEEGSSVIWDGMGRSSENTTITTKGREGEGSQQIQVSYDFVGRLFVLGESRDIAWNIECKVFVGGDLKYEMNKPVSWGYDNYCQMLGGASRSFVVNQGDVICGNGLRLSTPETFNHSGKAKFEFTCTSYSLS